MNLIHRIANALSPEARSYKDLYEGLIEAVKKLETENLCYRNKVIDGLATRASLTSEHNRLIVTYNDACMENNRLLRDLEAEKLSNQLLAKKAEQDLEYQNKLVAKIQRAKEALG